MDSAGGDSVPSHPRRPRSALDLVSADHPGVVKILSRITEAERKADRRIASAEAAQVPSGPLGVHLAADLGHDKVTGKVKVDG